MNEFKGIIENLIQLFEELTALETVKLNAARINQVSTIEECMTKEQTQILRLKGLEQARERKQEEMGFGGMSFQEILLKVTDDEREELLPLFDTLSRGIQMFQEVSEDATRIIEVNLRRLDKEIQSREGQVYVSSGRGQAEERHMTDRSV